MCCFNKVNLSVISLVYKRIIKIARFKNNGIQGSVLERAAPRLNGEVPRNVTSLFGLSMQLSRMRVAISHSSFAHLFLYHTTFLCGEKIKLFSESLQTDFLAYAIPTIYTIASFRLITQSSCLTYSFPTISTLLQSLMLRNSFKPPASVFILFRYESILTSKRSDFPATSQQQMQSPPAQNPKVLTLLKDPRVLKRTCNVVGNCRSWMHLTML